MVICVAIALFVAQTRIPAADGRLQLSGAAAAASLARDAAAEHSGPLEQGWAEGRES